MTKYCNVEPILHLLSGKDLLESVNVGAVLQALQHGLYNGEVAPVIHAHWVEETTSFYYGCSACKQYEDYKYKYCPNCGAKMDGKEGK